MPALLHDFCPFVQCLQLVLVHDERLLFKAEVASTRLLTVSRGLLDNSPLDVEVDSSSFEFPNVSGQRCILEFLVAVRVVGIIFLAGECPLVMVVPLLHRCTCQSCVDLGHWNLQSWNCLVGFLVLEGGLIDCASCLALLSFFEALVFTISFPVTIFWLQITPWICYLPVVARYYFLHVWHRGIADLHLLPVEVVVQEVVLLEVFVYQPEERGADVCFDVV